MSFVSLQPKTFCAALLAALEASEGRKRKRKRDQTPDTIGLLAKRELLERAVCEQPDAEEFEAWLHEYAACHEGGTALAMVTFTWPVMRSAMSGPVPLYGMCVIRTPAMDLKSSIARWLDEPAPAEA